MRRLVSGVRSSWPASATSARCPSREAASAAEHRVERCGEPGDLVAAVHLDRVQALRGGDVLGGDASAARPGAGRPGRWQHRPTRASATPTPPTSEQHEPRAGRAVWSISSVGWASTQRETVARTVGTATTRNAARRRSGGAQRLTAVPARDGELSGRPAAAASTCTTARTVPARRPAGARCAGRSGAKRAGRERCASGVGVARAAVLTGGVRTSDQLGVALRVQLVADRDVGGDRGEATARPTPTATSSPTAAAQAERARARPARDDVRRRARSRRRLAQRVADAAHRVDQAWLAVGLGLAPQIADVDLEGVGGRREVVAPDLLEDPVARRAPGAGGAGTARAGRTRSASAGSGARRGVTSRVPGSRRRSAKVSDASACPAVGRLGAAQQRAQPGQQLLEGERLDQVVVGAGVEAGHAVGDRVAGGEHQDRHVVAVGAQSPARLEAADPRHHHVEHERVGPLGAQPVERLARRPRPRRRRSR